MLNELKELSNELKKLLETAEDQRKNLYADLGIGGSVIVGSAELREVLKATASVARNIDEDIEGLKKLLVGFVEELVKPTDIPF